jgi:hypothetical protein
MKPGVTRQAAERIVKRQVAGVDSRGVVVEFSEFHLSAKIREFRNDRGVVGFGNEERGAPFDRGSKLVDFSRISPGQRDNEGPTTRLFLHETFRTKEFEGVTHGPAADSELLSNLRLDQALTLSKLTRQNCLSQLVPRVVN